MGLRSKLSGIGRTLGGEPHADGESELVVGDARYDDWAVLRDFTELETARAWRQTLTEGGVQSVLTADWPIDRFGHGDIALRVRDAEVQAAEELLEDPE